MPVVVTFVVRVWMPADAPADPAEPLHGTVEHVPSGRQAVFDSEGALLTFVRNALRAPAPEASAR